MRPPLLSALIFHAAAATALVSAFATAGNAPAAASPLEYFSPLGQVSRAPRFVSRVEAERIVRTIMQERAGSPAAFARMSLRRAPAPARKHVDVAGWVADNGGYLWGIDAKGSIETYHSDCALPGAGRVDHAGNLVVACTGGRQFNGIPGNVNFYKRGNNSNSANLVLTDSSGYFPVDAFEDNARNLYVVNLFQVVCGPMSCSFNPGDVERWSAGKQRNGALPDATYSDPNLNDVQSADIDAAGTIYVSGSALTNDAPEVDAISGGIATNLNIPLAVAGDVYVVDPNGRVPLLSVIDSGLFQLPGATLYQFALPIAPGASPLFTDATPQNAESSCNASGSGYGPGGAKFLVSIVNCQAIAYGRKSAGPSHWQVHENYDFTSPQIGLLVPSDK